MEAAAETERTVHKQKPWLFRPGQSGNLKGRPKGSRNRLTEDFLRSLSDDFSEHGAEAIRRTREEEPATYVRVVASLMPKQLEVSRPLEDLSDDELVAAVDALRASLARQGIGGDGTRVVDATLAEPAPRLPAVSEAG
jgi:hypothetical protein